MVDAADNNKQKDNDLLLQSGIHRIQSDNYQFYLYN